MKTFKQHVLTEAFTKQHYVAIAKILKDASDTAYKVSDDSTASELIDGIAQKLASVFAQDNPRFDKGFFLNACGL
jgi:hypothetical protein